MNRLERLEQDLLGVIDDLREDIGEVAYGKYHKAISALASQPQAQD